MHLTAQRRVLIIDSNEDTSFVISTLLAQSGFEAVISRNAEEGLELADSRHFDAFVIDEHLFDASGFEMCWRLVERYPTAPIIIHTEDSLRVRYEQEEKVKEERCAASALLFKPLGMFQLVPKLRRLLSSVADTQLCN